MDLNDSSGSVDVPFHFFTDFSKFQLEQALS